jgi:hypothetical protein
MLGLCVGDREARADSEGGELIDRVAAGAPVRKLLVNRGVRAYAAAIRRVKWCCGSRARTPSFRAHGGRTPELGHR